MNMINQKRFFGAAAQGLGEQPAGDAGFKPETPFSYLAGRPEAAQLIPHIVLCLETDPEVEKLRTYISFVEKGDLLQRHTGIIMLRKCLSIHKNTPIQEVIDANAVPLLIQMINDEAHPHLQIEATWCVTNLATGTTLQINSLVEKGVIPLYISLLKKPIVELVEQAIWGIGNIGADCIAFRNLLADASAMQALVDCYHRLKLERPKARDQIVWAASNLCRLKPVPDMAKIYQGIPMFSEMLLETTKQNVVTDCVWGLSQCARGETLRFFDPDGRSSLIKKIIELLANPQVVIVHPALRIVGVFTNGPDDVCQVPAAHPESPRLRRHPGARVPAQLHDQDRPQRRALVPLERDRRQRPADRRGHRQAVAARQGPESRRDRHRRRSPALTRSKLRASGPSATPPKTPPSSRSASSSAKTSSTSSRSTSCPHTTPKSSTSSSSRSRSSPIRLKPTS